MDCNESGLYALLADETTDKSTKEQVTICLRFIDPHNKYEIREEFLAFQEATDGISGEALADLLLSSLREHGVDVGKMCAQGYDGASNMSGRYRGVQARVREINPDTVYVHCKEHCLNLAIVHSCKEQCVRTIMGTVQDITFALDYSSKRLLAFCEELSGDENVQEQMDQRTKLRTLCETRWTSRADALLTFLRAFPVVVRALEHLQENGDVKAGQHLHVILKWDFIIDLVVCEHILQSTVFLSTFLQNVSCDLMEAARESEVVINTLTNERNDPEVWNALFEKASDVAGQFDVIPSKPRTAGLQGHRNNIPCRISHRILEEVMHSIHMTLELTDRLLGGTVHDRFLAQYLVASSIHRITLDIKGRLFDAFAQYLTPHDQHVFNAEKRRWETKWNGADVSIIKPTMLQDTLKECNWDLYPCISTMIRVLLTMPVSTSTAERSFSSLRRIETYLHSTMGQGRLSDLPLLHIHRDQQIDINSAIEQFATDKKKRASFWILSVFSDIQCMYYTDNYGLLGFT
ncbi:zinc finger MYM-type protein 1-like [Pecten maximus]|uniref:zinc finger MYM-type protein 1-like n=1 Tax=Pecten maximus TaxID=6579 RepID=UPI001457F3ED|nr:zinc finger MYM-type protein 1-like [Pecten maximus]